MKQNDVARTVMAFGSFDLIHPGHLFYLDNAKKKGDRLIVIIARNQTILKRKKKPPVFDEQDRLMLVSRLDMVDLTVLGDLKDPFKCLETYHPDILCFGYDQEVDLKSLKVYCVGKGILIPAFSRSPSYEPHKYKSSFYAKKIGLSR